MVGCTQGNWGLSVTVIDARGLPVIREHPGRSHVAPHPHLGGRPGGGVYRHRGHGGHGRKEQGDWGLNRAAHLVRARRGTFPSWLPGAQKQYCWLLGEGKVRVRNPARSRSITARDGRC